MEFELEIYININIFFVFSNLVKDLVQLPTLMPSNSPLFEHLYQYLNLQLQFYKFLQHWLDTNFIFIKSIIKKKNLSYKIWSKTFYHLFLVVPWPCLIFLSSLPSQPVQYNPITIFKSTKKNKIKSVKWIKVKNNEYYIGFIVKYFMLNFDLAIFVIYNLIWFTTVIRIVWLIRATINLIQI